MGVCSTQQEPCACASSHGDCFWNPEALACVPRQAAYTSCASCPLQGHCGDPDILSISPVPGSIVGSAASRSIEVTFDRPIRYTGGNGDIMVQCMSGEAEDLRPVPMSSLTLAGAVLQVDLSHMLNEEPAQCSFMINQAALTDYGGMRFAGLHSGAFRFVLADNVPPELISANPKNLSVVESLPAALTLTFSEDVQLGTGFFVELASVLSAVVSDEPHVLVAFEGPTAEGAHVTGNTLTLDLAKVRHRGVQGERYVVLLPAGVISDQSGNGFSGLEAGQLAFRIAMPGSRTLEFSLTIDKVDFATLRADTSMVRDVEQAVRQTIATALTGLVHPHDIEVDLSAGSVVARCRVHLSEDVNMDAARAAIGNSTLLGHALISRLTGISGFSETTTGAIAVTDMTHPHVIVAANPQKKVTSMSVAPQVLWSFFLSVHSALLVL